MKTTVWVNQDWTTWTERHQYAVEYSEAGHAALVEHRDQCLVGYIPDDPDGEGCGCRTVSAKDILDLPCEVSELLAVIQDLKDENAKVKAAYEAVAYREWEA